MVTRHYARPKEGVDMKRREFLSVVGGAIITPVTLPLVAGAQQGERVRVVGLLTPSDPEGRRRGLLQELEKLGYREGQNIALEVRSADSKLEQLPSLANELVRANVDVIVALNTPGTQAAIDTKTRIPIVMALVGNPVGSGFVPNLNRPGGSVTGASNAAGQIAGKRLAVLSRLSPPHGVLLFSHIRMIPSGFLSFAKLKKSPGPSVWKQKYFWSSSRATISSARLLPPWNGKPTRRFGSSPKPAYRSPNFKRSCCSGIACQECSPPGSMSKTAA
jgi:hypothetical protein